MSGFASWPLLHCSAVSHFRHRERGGERGDGGGTSGMMHVVARPPPSCREKSLSISVVLLMNDVQEGGREMLDAKPNGRRRCRDTVTGVFVVAVH